MDRVSLVVFLCITWGSLVFSQKKWSYDPNDVYGPGNWGGECGTGKRQSPIDINSTNATFDESLGTFTLKDYNKILDVTFRGSNNGHALEMTFPAKVYNVSGGGLTGVYTTVQFHFHWGPENSVGSEHTVNGKEYAAELHFVSYNTKYASLGQAVNHPDGLAVLGLLIEVGGENNTAFSFLEHARELTDSFSTISHIPAFKFDALLPYDKTKFFRYNGSLTTPTCKESVTWTVFNDAVKISQHQMNLLRSLKKNNSAPIFKNFRPVQPLNNRTVRASFQVSELNKTTIPTISTASNTTGATTSTTTTAPVSVNSSPTTTTTTAPTDYEAGSSSVTLTAGLFLFMVFSALFAH